MLLIPTNESISLGKSNNNKQNIEEISILINGNTIYNNKLNRLTASTIHPIISFACENIDFRWLSFEL